MPDELSLAKRRFGGLGLALGLALLAAIVWSVWRTSVEHREARAWVEHSVQVETKLDELRTDVEAVEAALRGYLMTGRESYLPPYEQARQQADRALAAIGDLTQDNAAQRIHIDRLQQRWDDEAGVMAGMVRLRRERGLDAVAGAALTDRAKQSMERIRAIIVIMRAEEERLLAVRHADDKALSTLRTQITVGLTVLAAFMGGLVLWLLRWIRRLQTSLVTICAWTRQVQYEGEWMTVEAYLHRRFGLRISHGISQKAAASMLADLRDTEAAAPDGEAPPPPQSRAG